MAVGTMALLAALAATPARDGSDFTPLPAPAAIVVSDPALTATLGDAHNDYARNDHARAVRCLAAAISYEAGNEPIAGQEAVAQVVLNRTRAPGYPKSVCGVVFQGSDRRTGCQFTFTCDGSLRRARSAQSLALANDVAERVLAGGGSEPPLGATHYHADYVNPYWAATLTRVTKIGRHIFYRAPIGVVAPGASAPALAPEDDSRLPPTPASAVPVATAAADPVRRLAAQSPSGVIFAPWGLQTLTVTAAGKARAVALPDAPPR
ncbi:MAG: cell wall hydrolase [Sphingomonas sp.]